jgi:hypothetical protein
MNRNALAPSLRQYELDQVQRVTALPFLAGFLSENREPLFGNPAYA